MKLIQSNGRVLTVRDAGTVIMELRAKDHPLPILDEVISDDKARKKLKDLMALGIYQRGVDNGKA